MFQPALDPQAVHDLQAILSGTLITRNDEDYDTARKVWNGMIDKYPALIVRCMDATDVIAAVTFARKQRMTVAVRSGGHSFAGHSTIDGGMLIDLSPMKAITIDRIRRIARIEPGLTWGEVARATHAYGLALTSGDMASVGVGGLMLGGGIGWMVRKHGQAIDHLRAVELVTASGEILRASERAHPELFWGLRGGGGNFGVSTAFEVDLHPAGTVLAGAVFYEAAQAERILQGYAQRATTAPDELSTQAMLMAAPPAPFIPQPLQGRPIVAILVCYTGDLAQGERVVAPLRQLATPIADVVGPIAYPALFALTQVGTLRGLEQHVRSLFLQTLSDEVLHTLTEETLATISPETIVQIRVLGGAMGRVSVDATAFAHRATQAMVIITNFGPPSANAKGRSARTEQVWQALQPYAKGVYVNFLAEEGEQRIHEAYPPATYARLAALKNLYDPTNFFHMNQNIKPFAKEACEVPQDRFSRSA
jgi:FAD/FMN-containing dehydrogenase